MEACIVICRTQKPAARQGKVLFIDAVHEVARERALSFLKPEHQQRILNAYHEFTDEPGFAAIATTEEILSKDGNLSIPRYVRRIAESVGSGADRDLRSMWAAFDASGREFWLQADVLVEMLEGAVAEEPSDA